MDEPPRRRTWNGTEPRNDSAWSSPSVLQRSFVPQDHQCRHCQGQGQDGEGAGEDQGRFGRNREGKAFVQPRRLTDHPGTEEQPECRD